MNWDQAKDALLMGLMTVVGGYVSFQLRKLVDSITDLNVKMAVIVSRVGEHEKRLDRIEGV